LNVSGFVSNQTVVTLNFPQRIDTATDNSADCRLSNVGHLNKR